MLRCRTNIIDLSSSRSPRFYKYSVFIHLCVISRTETYFFTAHPSLSPAPDQASDNTEVMLPPKAKKLTIHKSNSGSFGTNSTKNSTLKRKKKRCNGVTRPYRNPTKKKPKQNTNNCPRISNNSPQGKLKVKG